MGFEQFVASLTPDVIKRLRQGIENGKWPDGQLLTPEQRAKSLEAVLIWEARHLPEDQRTGYMAQKCAGNKNGKHREQEPQSILRFQDA